MELFNPESPTQEPLAARMRPRNLDEYVGQEHILSPGRLLRRAIESDRLGSLIFYGPPGTGKTTLAKVIAGHTSSQFLSLNAVLTGVKDIREVIEQAKSRRQFHNQKTILFVDEVHRWNKAQQDALLPMVENGTFVLIGATTENPYFEVNSALVSRSRIFQLVSLGNSDLKKIAELALKDSERGYGNYTVEILPDALAHLIETCEGDARSLLNALELAVEGSGVFPPTEDQRLIIDLDAAEQSIQKKVVLYDKDGDYHYDTISAFIKSLRGSDPDAALYWLARMVRAGEDPKFIFRRMLILASEDVGLADPQALVVVTSAAQAFDRVGLPEGQFHLAQAALYLSVCKKSNSTLAYFDALKDLENEKIADVPSHLKDGNRDKEAFGHGKGYLYPHAFRDHWAPQQYLPGSLAGKVFYTPSDQGWEGTLRDELLQRREILLDLQAPQSQEILSFAKTDNHWQKRLREDLDERRKTLRDWFFGGKNFPRHLKTWIASDQSGLLTLEAIRRFPEGGVWTRVDEIQEKERLEDFLVTVPTLNKPQLMVESLDESLKGEWPHMKEPLVDLILALSPSQDLDLMALVRRDLLLPGGLIRILYADPLASSRLSDFLPSNLLDSETYQLIVTAEEHFLQQKAPFQKQEILREGVWALTPLSFVTEMELSPKQWSAMLAPGRPGGLGEFLARALQPQITTQIQKLSFPKKVSWRRSYLMLEYEHQQ